MFLADPEGNQILTYTTHLETFTPLWSPQNEGPHDPYSLNGPKGVAISPENDLVVADTKNHRVIIYAFPSLLPRAILDAGIGEPWDIAYNSKGHLFIADAHNRCIHQYDRLWRRVETYFGGKDLLARPIHLAIDATDQVFVVDEVLQQVVGLDEKGNVTTREGRILNGIDLGILNASFPKPIQVSGQTLFLLQDERPLCPSLELKGLSVDKKGRLKGTPSHAVGSPFVTTLSSRAEYPRKGEIVLGPIDGKLFNFSWHRILIEGQIPKDASLTIRTLTSPDKLRNERVLGLTLGQWSTPISLLETDQPELLIQSPAGRYLWIHIELRGTGQNTPGIKTIKLLGPRNSSLAFLPPVFHEDVESAEFLDRFLSIFDTQFDNLSAIIEDFTGFLDPFEVPATDFLPWLASWFDLRFFATWTEQTRRTVMQRITSLYKKRGTLAGIKEMIRLHTGLDDRFPIIIEHFRLRDFQSRYSPDGLVNQSLYINGAPFMPSGNELAHHFTVILPRQVAQEDQEIDLLMQLINAQRPAHTQFQLQFIDTGIRIGCQSTIGVDTLLGRIEEGALGTLRLGQNSQLPTTSSLPRVGQSRLLFST